MAGKTPIAPILIADKATVAFSVESREDTVCLSELAGTEGDAR
jgi:hypothetical protein